MANLVEMRLRKGEARTVRIEQSPSRFPPRFVWNEVRQDALARAVSAASKADIVIAVAGITSALEGEEMTVNIPGFLGGDRTSLDLPADEEAVLKAVEDTLDGNKKNDPDDLAENVRRAARRAAHDAWGKKPITRVLVTEL